MKQKLITLIPILLMLVFIMCLQYVTVFHRQVLMKKSHDYWSGTAFFISRDGYLITAGHVAPSDTTKLYIRYKNKWILTKIVDTNSFRDVAILKADVQVDNPLPVSYKYISGMSVGILGYPLGTFNLTETTGRAAFGGIVTSSIFPRANSCPGNSGGPIINNQGEVVGILTVGYSDGEYGNDGCSNDSGGPVSTYIHDLSDEVQINLLKGNGVNKSFDYWYKMYHNSIVHVEGEN